MLFSFLVTLREGIEIALVVTILLGYLRNINQKRHFREIWIGVAAATLLSLAFGAVLEVTSHELDGPVLETFEGFTMLFAVGVLTWMVFWMKRQSAGMSSELRHQIDDALSHGSVVALALLAFSAVSREGIETALFLFAGSTSATSDAQFWIGGAFGFAIAVAAGAVLYYGAARLPLRQFFLASGIVVIVLAAGLLSNGLAELHSAGVIDHLGSRPWDADGIVSMSSTAGKFLHTVLGYDSEPAIAQIVLYCAYLLAVLSAYMFLPNGRPPAAGHRDAGAASALLGSGS
ncbi:MAG: FTR1 family protein [Chloroflexota bacterium]|nr:FTR1 family protein [Chloroflexota bacterium]